MINILVCPSCVFKFMYGMQVARQCNFQNAANKNLLTLLLHCTVGTIHFSFASS